MNWKQLYNAATPAERDQISLLLLQNSPIYAVLPAAGYHYVGAQRKIKNAQVLYMSIFMFILLTMSVTSWLVLFNVSPAYGAPCVLFWFIFIFSIFCMRPARRTRWA